MSTKLKHTPVRPTISVPHIHTRTRTRTRTSTHTHAYTSHKVGVHTAGTRSALIIAGSFISGFMQTITSYVNDLLRPDAALKQRSLGA